MALSDKNSILQVLGCLMKNCLLLAQKDKYNIQAIDFDDLFTRSIFAAINNFAAQGAKSVSIVDLDTYFQQYPDLKAEFDKNNGLDYLKDCETLSNPDSFDYHYNRLKKFSCLRQLQRKGFSIKEFYCENPLDPRAREIQEHFEESSVKDILDSCKINLSSIEKEFITSQLNESGSAAEGLRSLIDSFKQHPEIGKPLGGEIYSTVVQGARKGKYYIRSAGSGLGKSRLAVGEAASLAIPKYFDWHTMEWVDRGYQQKVLFITTELDRDEVQTMLLANISGINERKILQNILTFKEIEILNQAVEIVEAFSDNFILDKIPDPSIAQIESCVRNHVLVDGVEAVFYDYIFSSPSLLAEFSSARLREDVVLFMLSTALKDLATELNVFISTSTQLSGDYKIQKGIRDQTFIRGSKAVVDKADVGSILVRVCEEELGIITPVCQQLGLPIPTHVIDVYKNRRSEYNQVKIWCKIDLGTCREQDLLITTGSYEPIDDFNLLTYSAAKRNSYTIEGTFDEVSEDTNYAPAATNSTEQNDRVDEEVIVEPKDLSLKPEEKPPFNGPVEMTDASGSTYIENELDFSKVQYKGVVRKGRFAF